MPLFDPNTQRQTPEFAALLSECRAQCIEHILPLLKAYCKDKTAVETLAVMYLVREDVGVIFERVWTARGRKE